MGEWGRRRKIEESPPDLLHSLSQVIVATEGRCAFSNEEEIALGA